MPRLDDRLDREARSFHPSPDAFDRVLERAHRRERTRRVAAGIVALGIVVAGALSVTLAMSTGRTSPPASPAPPSPSGASPSPSVVHVPDHIGSLVWTGNALWALGADSRRPVDAYLLRLDPSTGEVVASSVLPGAVTLAYGDGSLWASTWERGRLIELDPTTGEIRRSFPFGDLSFGPSLATDGGTVFVVVDYSIMRLEPGDDRPVELVTLKRGGNAAGIAFGAGSLWVADSFNGTVLRLDPATGAVLARIRAAAFEGAGVAFAGGAVWAMGPRMVAENLLKIDPATNTVVDKVAGGWPALAAESPGAVWIGGWKIDLATDRSTRIFEDVSGLAVVGDVLWIADSTDHVTALPTCTPDCETTTGASG